MTDKELLELAARAAGVYASDDISDCWCEDHKDEDGFDAYPRQGFWTINGVWNPLYSDEQAFRLAVKLGIDIHFRCTGTYTNTERLQEEFFEPNSPDFYAATRRAIVRAAAAIGEGMK